MSKETKYKIQNTKLPIMAMLASSDFTATIKIPPVELDQMITRSSLRLITQARVAQDKH